ncbi:AAA family ATPase [Ochrobactrum daejeonense]|nr:AAA family ATPase [Brucella daejeonensis]
MVAIPGTKSVVYDPDKPAPELQASNDNDPAKGKQVLNLRDWTSSIYASEPPPVEYLVDGVIEKGIPGLIAAMGEVGKSYLMLELARRVAFGSSRFASNFGGKLFRRVRRSFSRARMTATHFIGVCMQSTRNRPA